MIKHQNKIIAHATTAQQAKELKALTATLKEQAAQIQKVGAQLVFEIAGVLVRVVVQFEI